MRRFRVRRRFPRPRGRGVGSPKWFTTMFNEGALTLDTTATEFVIVNPVVYTPAEDREINRVFQVKRIIVKGGIGVAPLLTATATEINAWFWALHTIDVEDTDGLSVASTGAGTIWNSERVLQCGCEVMTNIESTTTPGSQFVPQLRVDIDLRTPVNIRQDQQIVLGIAVGNTATSTVALANFSAIARALIVPP